MQKEIKERIINLIQENEQSSRNELVQIAINEIKIPEYEVLADRYVANVIAQTAATIRDEKNRRTVLARRGKDGTYYINLLKCTDKQILKNLKTKIEKDIKGRQASLKKVNLKLNSLQYNFFNQIDEQTKLINQNGGGS